MPTKLAKRFVSEGVRRKISPPELVGHCPCRKHVFTAQGLSSSNFITHSSAPREASGDKYMRAAGFRPEYVSWSDTVRSSHRFPELQPSGSQNEHFFCGCDRKAYLGVDATRLLGVVAVNLKCCDTVPESYQPTHHVFYDSRVEDVDDNLPKWATVPQGKVVDKGGKAGFEKDVLPLSPIRPPEPREYHFTESDPIPNHRTVVSPEKVIERVSRKYDPSPGVFVAPKKLRRDAIVIGGGHNGLVTAAYLAKHGVDTLVLERRHVVGGAAVTEEIIEGFKFSRASYLAGLLRPCIIKELELERHGLKYLPRNPSSFTPQRGTAPYLILGDDAEENARSIAQFSKEDAVAFEEYEKFLGVAREIVQPLLDGPPPDILDGTLAQRANTMKQLRQLVSVGWKHRQSLVSFYELFTGPATQILDRWFDSEILKTTLATDAVIGALVSPSAAGSAYVLLHHVMGEAAGKKGVWAYVEGGMGAVSNAIASAAKEHGVEISTNATVRKILYKDNRATGVEMADGTTIEADVVVSCTNPYHTFLELLPGLARDTGFDEASPLPREFQHHIRFLEQACGAFKINCAVDRLPNFTCYPSPANGTPGPMHRGTIHFESRLEEIENAFREASMGKPATRPVVEMTIPSSVDRTVAPEGKHVVQLFVQYAPYDVNPKLGNWADPAFKEAFVQRVFSIVDEFAPGFSDSVIGYDALSPLDLERVFGLHKGNIFHGALALHQLAYARPAPGWCSYRSPLQGLYMGASGTHPGGGVMGAPGRNCARVLLADLGKRF